MVFPSLVIECKSPDTDVDQAISQTIRNQGENYIPQFFTYTQLLLAINKNQAKYGAVGTAKEFWSVWNELEDAERAVNYCLNKRLSETDKDALFCADFASARSHFDALDEEGRVVTLQDRCIHCACVELPVKNATLTPMANKTLPTTQSVADFFATITHTQKRADAIALDTLFKKVTGYNPVMWGETMVGYGQYHYTYESGRQGDFLATGFSPRKANFSVYILPGYTDFGHILKDIGKHKLGKSCLYFNKLADIDTDVLAVLIRAGLDDLNTRWPVIPT